MFLEEVSKATLQLFFPKKCESCSRDLEMKEDFICLHCKQEMKFIKGDAHAKKMLQSVFKGRMEVENIWALYQYFEEGNVKNIPQKIKYQGGKQLGHYMGRMLGEVLPKEHDIDLIIPLPLHYKKERLRGFNQSAVIATGISEITKIPVEKRGLERVKYNASQTKFSKYDRWDNVRSIFQLTRPSLFENKHILLVDDVLTTGATLESAAQEILKADNSRISIGTLAARL